jgi:iron(III) transport system substrate-binding protein
MLAGCGSKKADSKNITIWTSGEDYRNEFYLSECKKKFPDYNITLEYMNSSSIAAKVKEEGKNCSCDIILSEEYNYLNMCEDYLAELKDFDYSVFLNDIVSDNHKFTPELKNGGCIILNPAVLKAKGLTAPTCYEDLLDPKYKGLISMPSPTSSGTGYMFLRQLTNEWGEDKAFEYFEKLTPNILQYTSSGSGPVNALVQGEVAIGLGMTAQAVVEINEGVDLDIVFFDEGSPYSMYGNAVLAQSASRQCVMDVFNYLATDLCKENNKRYAPDQIYKDFVPELKGYPTNINYSNMSSDTLNEKERLLSKWTFS